ncbi:MAG: SMP-30/gluconolactonase/LRE family protein [Puniceicoccales bacterium]|jgi:gluconolactonase|nr:SMP-30/gluconolactonase/LRE family protein [Puniceicoccales bacterium]
MKFPRRKNVLPAVAATFALAFATLPPASAAGENTAAAVAASGATLEKLAGGFSFTEGPAADAAGNVFFTDQPKNKIWRWGTDGKLTLFHDAPGRANGLWFTTGGQLLACADAANELWRVDPKTRRHTVLAKGFRGRRLNGPNDVWERPDGGIYFTDPMYARPYWKGVRPSKIEQDTGSGQHVYFLPPPAAKDGAGKGTAGGDVGALRRVADDLVQPNGLIGTRDGKTLYVADIGANKTYRYTVRPDGSLAGKTLFAPLGSDGMTLDAAGNVYLTGKGVTVFDPRGRQIAHIAVPGGWTANVCFGGAARDELFITATSTLWRLKMRVRGAW